MDSNTLFSPRLRLSREFYAQAPEVVAPRLLGAILVSRSSEGIAAGEIVETEAYLAQGDSACHSARGRTPRNGVMFGPAGHAYVYAIHAKWCFNVVTENESFPSAVLIRALRPILGEELMAKRRGTAKTLDLARGPARLTQAMGIDKRFNGVDLVESNSLWIGSPSELKNGWISPQDAAHSILVTKRIGVTSAFDLPLRFVMARFPFVSGSAKQNVGLPYDRPLEDRMTVG